MGSRSESLTGVAGNNLSADELHNYPWNVTSKPELETTVVKGQDIEIAPVAPISDGGPYEFFVPSYDNEYTDLTKTRLTGWIQVKKISDNGTETDAVEGDDYSIINNIGMNLFKQVEIFANGTQLQDPSTATHSFKSYIETALSFNENTQNSALQTCYFFKEKNGTEQQHKEAGGDSNSGYMKRKPYIKNSKKCFFVSDTFIDLFKCNSYLPFGVNLKIRFFRNNDEFILMHDDAKKYKIKILDLKLRLKRVHLKPETIAKHSSHFEKGGMSILPFQSVQMTTHTVPIGISTLNIPHIAHGVLPAQVMVAFVKGEAFHGSPKLNPFKFENMDVSNFCYRLNGVQYPSVALRPDMSEKRGEVMLLYQQLLDVIGCGRENTTINITPEDFVSNLTLFALDLTGDTCNQYHFHLPQSGSLGVEFSFSSKPTEVHQLLVFQVYNKALTIEGSDRVTNLKDLM